MNVWILGYGVPDNKYPINGIFSYNQAQAIEKLNKSINVVYISLDIRSLRRWRKWGLNIYQKGGMNIIDCSLPIGNVHQNAKNFVYYILLGRALNKAFKRFGKPDIIHAHFTEIAYAVLRYKEKWNVPIVITEHSSGINADVIASYTRKMAEYAYPKADCVIAVSPNFQSKIYKEFGVRPIYIPNMVDSNIFNLNEQIKRKTASMYHFISIGRLVPVKNFELLISGFCKAFDSADKVDLTIVGDGQEKEKLKKLVCVNHRETQIHLAGQKTNIEVAALLKESDCFILTSNSETFGVVCVEALMCGKPVISTRSGGPDCLIDDSNGILIPVGSEECLVNALREISDKRDNYNSRTISANAVGEFSQARVVGKLVEEYKKLLR